MRFDAGPEDEFEAACGLLVDRLVRWAGEQGLPVDGFLAGAALEYRHRATVDGRLGLWEPRHVEELLLCRLPQAITELGQGRDRRRTGLRAHGPARTRRAQGAAARARVASGRHARNARCSSGKRRGRRGR